MARSSLPLLTPVIVADAEGQLVLAIDRLLARHPELRRLRRQTIRRQDELRRLVSDAAWKVYLAVEEAEGRSKAAASAIVARWAFGEGRKSAKRRP